MKRIVLCFDGTWNHLGAKHPTNVVLTAQSIAPIAKDGTAQVVFYDDGVGTAAFEAIRGGAFGRGLVKNLEDGYRFLIFNYEPGDEIYVFGFSRGAFTARSFIGLIGTVGVLIRHEAKYAGEAIKAYRQLDRETVSPGYAQQLRAERSPLVVVSEDDREWRVRHGYDDAADLPLVNIAFVGVWDTVGSLGVPKGVSFASLINRKHQFHDTSLSRMVQRARHAVAIDERRTTFAPTLWDNIDKLNGYSELAQASSGDLRERPYQQVWFPGTHGAVGGGGDRRGLSDNALQWVWEGAQQAGLEFSNHQRSLIYSLKPDHTDWLDNSSGRMRLFWRFLAKFARDRQNGPTRLDQVSASTVRRWHMTADKVKERELYHPGTLDDVAEELNATVPKDAELASAISDQSIRTHHKVQPGETLSQLAKEYYGKGTKDQWIHIFNFNTDKLDHPDRIYAGQILRIPHQP